MNNNTVGFIDFFKDVSDHRLDGRKLHTVEKILLLIFCGIIADYNNNFLNSVLMAQF